MLQRTGEAETITTHYLFALGIYRALYIPNWLYRYFAEGHTDPISWLAGIIQTILYSDFFWIYYTKLVNQFLSFELENVSGCPDADLYLQGYAWEEVQSSSVGIRPRKFCDD
jgi:hypothetical protein